MIYNVDKNMNLYQMSPDTHVPSGFGAPVRQVHESSVNFSPETVTKTMIMMQKSAKANAWNATQKAAQLVKNVAKKKNYEAAVRAQVLGREAQHPMSRSESMIKKEVIRQKMFGAEDEGSIQANGNTTLVDGGGHVANFDISEQVPGVSYSAGVHSGGDYNQNRPVNPAYANLPVGANGSAAITDWPKRVPTQFWNQPVEPPSNYQVPQSAYRAASGLGDYFDDVADGLLESQVNFAAQQLAQTTPQTAMGAMPSYEISPLTQGPAGVMATLFPGNITLPVVGSVPQVNIVYAGLALFGLGVLSRLRGG